MKAPINWLEEYIKIRSTIKNLMWNMTEVGMTCESYNEVEEDKVLDIEVTPNRPDWLSIIGLAREISLIENSALNLPKLPNIPKAKTKLKLKIKIKTDLIGRYSGILIKGVNVKSSPIWMQKRLKQMNLRPINNLVDITNYVMYEMGIPIHVFDYDKFNTKELEMTLSEGGEEFTSVDGISYKLPKNTLIIKDKSRVIDLCGIKGGKNTGISDNTKNIFIHIPIYSPVLIRKTSQQLKLASDASYIYERGPDLGGTINSLKRTIELVIQLAGGDVASDIYDIKSKNYEAKKITLSYKELINSLGLEIDINRVKVIFQKLNFNPKIKNNNFSLSIPTYRDDIKIKEDLYEEIARFYGYNKFPRNLPEGTVSKIQIPYFYDRRFEVELKNIIASSGYTETNTLSLTSEEIIKKSNLNFDNHIRIANPVSKEFEYLRTSIIPNLLLAIKLNSEIEDIKLFEYNKVYIGPVDEAEETYRISATNNRGSYQEIKGLTELLLQKYNITDYELKPFTVKSGLWHPVRAAVLEKADMQIGIVGELNPEVINNFELNSVIYGLELDTGVLKRLQNEKVFKDIPKYPPQIEDITINIQKNTDIGKVIQSIKSESKLITEVFLRDKFNDKYTFRIYYQDPNKTLTDEEIKEVRKQIMKKLKLFSIKL